jgi:hypothetical protein
MGKTEVKETTSKPYQDEKIILKWLLKIIGWECADWMHLAEDKCQWREVVDVVTLRPDPLIIVLVTCARMS